MGHYRGRAEKAEVPVGPGIGGACRAKLPDPLDLFLVLRKVGLDRQIEFFLKLSKAP
jgi:hypothetical protein